MVPLAVLSGTEQEDEALLLTNPPMEEKIQQAVDHLVKMEYITINKQLVPQVVMIIIRDHIANASFRDVMSFFMNP